MVDGWIGEERFTKEREWKMYEYTLKNICMNIFALYTIKSNNQIINKYQIINQGKSNLFIQ